MPVILASASSIRRAMLELAGVALSVVPATIDEAAEKQAHGGDASGLAESLARKKALNVSRLHGDDWVIGSDSLVVVDGRQFDKPANRDEAAEHLRFFSGKPLTLISAVALAKGGEIDWSFRDSATLHVRPLSERFIAGYLDAEWPEVGYCVGVFRMEGRGIQLFDSIEGSYFTILGMPLLPLLGALRARKAIPS